MFILGYLLFLMIPVFLVLSLSVIGFFGYNGGMEWLLEYVNVNVLFSKRFPPRQPAAPLRPGRCQSYSSVG